MKKSEFKKLKVGDTVRLRTLDELKQLKCFDELRCGVVDDDGCLRVTVTRHYPQLLGKSYTIENIGEYGVYIRDEYGVTHSYFPLFGVVRQHLKRGC